MQISNFFILLSSQIICRQLDDYLTGNEIPKVELGVISDNPHEPLDHTIQLTGVMSPHDSIRISRPLQEPPLSESVDGQWERPAEQRKSQAAEQRERPAEEQKSRAEQQERPAEQQEKPVQHQEKPIQQPEKSKEQQKRPIAGNLLLHWLAQLLHFCKVECILLIHGYNTAKIILSTF